MIVSSEATVSQYDAPILWSREQNMMARAITNETALRARGCPRGREHGKSMGASPAMDEGESLKRTLKTSPGAFDYRRHPRLNGLLEFEARSSAY
jgi:hypothetical protein